MSFIHVKGDALQISAWSNPTYQSRSTCFNSCQSSSRQIFLRSGYTSTSQPWTWSVRTIQIVATSKDRSSDLDHNIEQRSSTYESTQCTVIQSTKVTFYNQQPDSKLGRIFSKRIAIVSSLSVIVPNPKSTWWLPLVTLRMLSFVCFCLGVPGFVCVFIPL